MDKYIHSLDKTLYELDLDEVKKIVNVLLEAKRNKKFVYIFGNGGSSSTVSHFVNDLQKIASVKALSLNDNVPLMTAWGHDESFSSISSRQLSNLVSDGDIVIAISASGNSKNIIEALELVSELNVITIGLTGNDGG
jgi:D-sedoheptulose 7-phosphate isomerase